MHISSLPLHGSVTCLMKALEIHLRNVNLTRLGGEGFSMVESVDKVVSKRWEVLSRTILPHNYVFSKTCEYALKHRECAMAIATENGSSVYFTKPVPLPSNLPSRREAFIFRRRLYYVKPLKVIDSYLVLTPDELELPSSWDANRNLKVFTRAAKPYLDAVDDILRRRFATIVIRLSGRSPLILRRQAVTGPQVLTIDQLFSQLGLSPDVAQPIGEVLFRGKAGPAPTPAKGRKSRAAPASISATYLALEDGRIILPRPGAIRVQEYVKLGEVPYHFEYVEGPVPAKQIVTSFLHIGNQSVASLLEKYSDLAFMPFFLDAYKQQGGPPIRHVALLDGRLIIGRTPDSTPNEGKFEVMLAKARVEEYLPRQ